MCIGKNPGGWCNSADPYIGFEGAFKCLLEAGDVAFLKHTTVQEMISSQLYRGKSTDEFELLCKNGQRMPVNEYLQCNWGLVPTNALVVSSARTAKDRRRFQQFLQSAVKHQSHKASTNYSVNYNNNNNNNNQNDRFNINNNKDNRFNDRFNRFSSTERNDRFPFGFSTTTANPFNDSIKYESFEMFESSRYGGRRLNLMFQVSLFFPI